MSEELEYVRNYIGIQQIRFPDKLDYSIKAPLELMELLIPPLTIQSFVENSTKYGVCLDRDLWIDIEIAVQGEREDSIAITIKDNGHGFEETVLERLNAGKYFTEDGSGIGISNVRRRLELLYGNEANLKFANEGGAVVTVNLPMLPLHNNARI